MSPYQEKDVKFYGFDPVPRSQDVLFSNVASANSKQPSQHEEWSIKDFPFPDSAVVRDVKDFVKKELNEETWNHSNRVYVYGMAITKAHFPSWSFDPETYYLTCLLHDIGTAERYLSTTKMSFEFKGAIVARDLLLELGRKHDSSNAKGREDQADSVCEAIIRHQDVFVNGGNITMIGQVIQLSTLFDNAGQRSYLLHPNLIKSVTHEFSNKGWLECFSSVVEKELSIKPWCHTSTFEEPDFQLDNNGAPVKDGPSGWRSDNFASTVRENKVMREFYDD